MQILECTTLEAIEANFPLLVQLYPDLSKEKYRIYVQDMLQTGYRQIGCFVEGSCVAVTGFHCTTHLSSGKYLYVDDLITDSKHRGKHYASALLQHVEQEAVRLGCGYIFLDAFVENNPAHKLYHAHGFAIAAFHFIKSLESTL